MSNDNNTKDIDNLIGDLTEELSPIKKLWCPYRHFALWAVLSAVYFVSILFVIGFRYDLADKLQTANFLYEGTLGVLFSLTAALCASFLNIPDMRGKEWFKAVPITLFGAFMLWTVIKAIAHGLDMPNLYWAQCISNALFIGGFPLFFIIILSLRGKTTQPVWMATMNVLAVAGITWIGLRVTCSIDDMGYAFLYHFLPVSIVGALTILMGRKLFKW
ncbi:MAG: NrsF family protein [Pseudomonadota bacterium]